MATLSLLERLGDHRGMGGYGAQITPYKSIELFD
jgi:hypothetical protein